MADCKLSWMWFPKKADLMDPSLAFVVQKSSKRVRDSKRLHPALFLLRGFCLGELPGLRSFVFLIKRLICCLFLPSIFPFFHLHQHPPELVRLLTTLEGIAGRVSGPWRLNPWKFEPLHGVYSVLYLLVLILSLFSLAIAMLDSTTDLQEQKKKKR